MAGSNTHYDGVLRSITGVEKSSKAGSTKDSLSWLRDQATALANPAGSQIASHSKWPKSLDQSFVTTRLDTSAIGRMMMYTYDPKWKHTLPYYDAFPLILMVDYTKDGWYGLNLHYVPPMIRIKIIEALQENLNSSSLNEAAKIKLNYQVLRNSSAYDVIKPCFKRYLASHVRSPFLFVDPKDWKKAVMLPTERFKKETKANVHRHFYANHKG